MAYGAGIDLGTTYSAAAIAVDDRAEVFELGTRRAAIPSVVLLSADGSVIVGEAAERRSMLEAGRTAREFKRRLGDPTPILLGGTPYGAEALTARLLAAIVDQIATERGSPPDTVVVTHPAAYGPYKMEVLEQAARLADVGTVEFLPEPVAAAIHYAAGEALDDGDLVAVYDFGGGTVDLAVLRKTATGWDIVGTPEGMERLGGVDLDAAVLAHVRTVVGDALDGLDQSDPAVLSAMAALRGACRDAKEALSQDTEAVIPVMLPGIHTNVRLVRSEFEALIRPRIEETVRALERVTRSADTDYADLSRVLLVGGASRIPLIAEVVRGATGLPIALDANPKLAVALGAARHAAAPPERAVAAAAAPPEPEPEPEPESRPEPEPEPPRPPQAPSAPVRAGRRKLWAGVTAVAAAAAIGVGGFLALSGGGDDPAGTTGAPEQVTAALPPSTTTTAPPDTTSEAAPEDTITTTTAPATWVAPDLTGAEITVLIRGGGVDDLPATQRVLNELFGGPTGASVEVLTVEEVTTELDRRLGTDEMPEFAVMPSTLIEEYVFAGGAVSLESMGYDASEMEDVFGSFLRSSTGVGIDHYGIPFSLRGVKDVVFYHLPTFAAEGYEVPTTWDDLIALSDRMVGDGYAPWCLGLESDDATGWPVTDWIETTLIRTTDLDTYDAWTYHDMPFDDDSVLRAAEHVADIIFGSGYVAGDPAASLDLSFIEAFNELLDAAPGCLMNRQGSFMLEITDPDLPDREVGRTIGAFLLPPIDQAGAIVSVNVLVPFRDEPETLALIEALLYPEIHCSLAADRLGGSFATHPGVTADCYPEPAQDVAGGVAAAVQTGTLREDASDQMPEDVRTAFYEAITRWMQDGRDGIGDLLADVEQAWGA